MQTLGGFSISLVRQFRGIENPEPVRDLVDGYHGSPAPVVVSMNALEPAGVVPLPSAIALVLALTAGTQIANPIVGPIAINMIDMIWPFPGSQRDRDSVKPIHVAMGKIDDHVPRAFAKGSCWLSGEPGVETSPATRSSEVFSRTLFPPKFTTLRFVGKSLPDI
ncbi:hypothetical protein QK396_30240 [Pseudomonas aeruginosa]|nr:hypothetical protein [Pseudomonas aeruginosa]MDI3653179.1 hypothetical protein [Pseudomonas aeruginosa]